MHLCDKLAAVFSQRKGKSDVWDRLTCLTVIICSFCLLAPSSVQGVVTKGRNIVLVITDDQDYEHLGFMGNQFARAPAIDSLAPSSTVFGYGQATMWRCRPTLASLLSDRCPHQSGMYCNYGPGQLAANGSLAALLASAGHVCYAEGRFWLGDPRRLGLTHGKGRAPRSFLRRGQADLFNSIDQFAGKQPMFIWWAPLLSHTPANLPPKYLRLFDPRELPALPHLKSSLNVSRSRPKRAGVAPAKRDKRRELLIARDPPELFKQKELRLYAMDTWLHAGVRQLMENLSRLAQHANTPCVFVIDSGWCNGLVSFGSPFEKGLPAPIVFTIPESARAGKKLDDLVSAIDIYPTVLDYAGLQVPKAAAGLSLRAWIEGLDGRRRDAICGAIYPASATKKRLPAGTRCPWHSAARA